MARTLVPQHSRGKPCRLGGLQQDRERVAALLVELAHFDLEARLGDAKLDHLRQVVHRLGARCALSESTHDLAFRDPTATLFFDVTDEHGYSPASASMRSHTASGMRSYCGTKSSNSRSGCVQTQI